MTDTILQQVTKQVKKIMEAVNSMRPLPAFDYVPAIGRELSHRHASVESLRRSDEAHPGARMGSNSMTMYTPYVTNSRRRPMLIKPQPMTVALKLHNMQMYCEFYEQKGRTTAERRELKKALHELADKGPRALYKKRDPVHQEPREEECSTDIVATIASKYAEDITCSAWKA
ncbi:hypothetical protein Cgig2_007774 [Carnegiea gigantea]|uniref:Uncharacterized protein n=1 Tax=Carnegiea gigantea TaxID=171969 RepID=A0A9Q1JND9_9CARY|nr:hypothetical protein Cgig2_007774 [Carnegiea gigantea]